MRNFGSTLVAYFGILIAVFCLQTVTFCVVDIVYIACFFTIARGDWGHYNSIHPSLFSLVH